MNYRWVINQCADEEIVQTLAVSQNIFPTIAKILVSRGIDTPEDAYRFFHPSLDDLHSPFLMDDMEKAIERIERAIAARERIWVYGDYDVDGTVSTAMLFHFLRKIGAIASYYVPDRFSEGYGLSMDGIDLAKTEGVSLIIAVDSGITAVEQIRHAHEIGVDFIICDHHEPAEEAPPAYAILDPIKGTCPYPFKPLCASGVVFKLITAICHRLGKPEIAFEYLDFAAVASAADMVPLINENRILVHFGLKQFNSAPRPGFRALAECSHIALGNVTSSTIVYNLAPRINAAGRLGDAAKAVELMLTEDHLVAFRLAQDLESKNHQRRVIDEKTFSAAIAMADDLLQQKHYRSLVLHNPDWHVGVINIVASRIVEKYYLPTVMLTSIDGVAKGSARSIKNFDIHSTLKQCQEHIKQFGGHKYASGLSLEEADIPNFRQAFDDIAQNIISDDMLVPEILIDTEVGFNELSQKFIEMLEQFAPFGYHNPKPTFLTQYVQAATRANVVGKNHLKVKLKQGHFIFDAIGFNLGDKLEMCNSGKHLSIVFTIEETLYANRRNLQLSLKDMRYTDEAKSNMRLDKK